MTQEGFYLSPRMAGVFFRCCRMFGINDYSERLALIRKMTARKKVNYIRDVDEFVKDKKILRLEDKNAKRKDLEG